MPAAIGGNNQGTLTAPEFDFAAFYNLRCLDLGERVRFWLIIYPGAAVKWILRPQTPSTATVKFGRSRRKTGANRVQSRHTRLLLLT